MIEKAKALGQQSNPFSMPPMASPACDMMLHETMVGVFQILSAQGAVAWPSPRSAAEALVQKALGTVELHMPDEWDKVGNLMSVAESSGFMHLLSVAASELKKYTLDNLFAIRAQAFAHSVSNVGASATPMLQGPSKVIER